MTRLEHHHPSKVLYQHALLFPKHRKFRGCPENTAQIYRSLPGKKQVLHWDPKIKMHTHFLGNQGKKKSISMHFCAATRRLLTWKYLGHLDWSLEHAMTFNRQHLTVPKPFAALGEIMITREKSYYCHHAFIMQMILR